ncbi:MAG: hypothetical protein WC729_06270 [Sphingomonas sp.]|jgi:hypothetical protein|uniref:hypothetical protein n=1 Tax=Sphingomonas sp. TaxID=28214 RepID=UPI0035658CE8
MLNDRLSAARKVAQILIPAERNLDASLRSNAELTLAMLAAREEARLPLSIASDALRHNADANVALAQAWSSIALVHGALRTVQRDIGLDGFKAWFGDQIPCEDAPTGASVVVPIGTAA